MKILLVRTCLSWIWFSRVPVWTMAFITLSNLVWTMYVFTLDYECVFARVCQSDTIVLLLCGSFGDEWFYDLSTMTYRVQFWLNFIRPFADCSCPMLDCVQITRLNKFVQPFYLRFPVGPALTSNGLSVGLVDIRLRRGCWYARLSLGFYWRVDRKCERANGCEGIWNADGRIVMSAFHGTNVFTNVRVFGVWFWHVRSCCVNAISASW